MGKDNILIIGANGQIGTELFLALQKLYGQDGVVASDLQLSHSQNGIYTALDVLDKAALLGVIKKYNITQVYHLAAMLSANAEKHPEKAWHLNMESLFNVLNLAKEKIVNKVYWPSSIAVFGSNSPKQNTPQFTVCEPSTVYGISKLAGERWCEYYHNKYKVDVRSVRYPGLISHSAPPGGGTTDYAVAIFHEAIQKKSYTCFLKENTKLPMMYMPDAIDATIQIMQAETENIKIRSSYNVTAFSFSPKDLANAITKIQPDFSMRYAPDFRQQIADSWPQTIADNHAKKDWQWQPKYQFETMVKDMWTHLQQKITNKAD